MALSISARCPAEKASPVATGPTSICGAVARARAHGGRRGLVDRVDATARTTEPLRLAAPHLARMVALALAHGRDVHEERDQDEQPEGDQHEDQERAHGGGLARV